MLFYRMSLINPIFSDKVIDIWNRLGDMLWGFPGVLKYNRKDKILTNMLGLIESKFDNEQAAREHFNSLSSFEWSRFFEEFLEMANKMTAPLMLYYEQHDLEFGRNCDIDEESKELLSQLLSKVQKSNLLIKTMSVGNSGYLFRGNV